MGGKLQVLQNGEPPDSALPATRHAEDAQRQPLQGTVQVNAETAARSETTKEWQVNPSVHDIRQDDAGQNIEQEQCNRSFDLVKIKYLKFYNVTSVLLTNLELSTSQKGMYITYKTDIQK